MPQDSSTRTAHATRPWRLVLLGLLIAAIVVVPFTLLREASRRALEAERRVSHTQKVESSAHALMFALRDLELAALLRGSGVDTPLVRERIAAGARDVPARMRRLLALTRDNVDQQVRLGGLRTNVEQRVQTAQRIGAMAPGTANAEVLRDMALRNQVRSVALAVIAEEHAILETRNRAAQRLERQANALGWGAMLAQLLVLLVLAWLVRRQQRQRIASETTLLRVSARAQRVLQTVREPIMLLDDQQRIVMHNAAFGELYGVGETGGQGLSLVDVGEGAWSEPATLQRLADVLTRNRELWDFTQAQRTSDGRERHMLINARRMPLVEDGEDVALVTVTDITSHKFAEEQMRELNRQLEGKVDQISEVNKELEAFSYSVSHDLRAPLRHVAGFADKLGRHLGDAADERSRHYLDVIGSSARRMSTLIDDLLVYSRLGRGAMRLQAVDMQSLVAETRAILDANLAADAPQRRVDWLIAPLPIVVADENMMRQVWLNLLGNAIKYSDRAERARIEVLYARDDDNAHHFRVRDNGAGFDMQYATKLFGVFQRMHKASDYPGTGIGLASVRRVLQRHGGRIWAESAIDAGSTFHFVLPASLDAPPSITGTPA